MNEPSLHRRRGAWTAPPAPGSGVRLRHAKRGLTLLEVLIGLTLIALAFGMALEGIAMCRSLGTRAVVMQQLSLAAQEHLARAAAEPFDQLTSGSMESQCLLGGGEAGRGTDGRIPASIRRTVSIESPNLKEITVRAEWSGGKQPLGVTLATRVARAPQAASQAPPPALERGKANE